MSDDEGGVSEDGVQKTYYTCQTATIAGDGSKWVYQTSFFEPSSPDVSVSVQRWKPGTGVDEFGSVALARTSNGTFTDGEKLTLTFKNKANGKPSVAVVHHSTGLKASAENGYCVQHVVDAPTHTPHDFFYGGRSALTRKWKVYRVGEALVDASDPYVIDLHVDPVSDPSKSSSGTMRLLAPCGLLANAPLTGFYANNTRAGVMGLLSTALSLWGSFNCASQGGVSDQLAGLTAFPGVKKLWKLPKDRFETPCGGSSSETLYANGYLFTNPDAIFVMCIKMYEPVESGHQPYIRVLAANPMDFEVSPWMTLIPAD
jgi:hypothetical protein